MQFNLFKCKAMHIQAINPPPFAYARDWVCVACNYPRGKKKNSGVIADSSMEMSAQFLAAVKMAKLRLGIIQGKDWK